MQLELPRTGLNGSALVELLAQLALTDRPAAPPSFVEGLGRWLGWKDAIGLSAVLQTAAVAAPVAADVAAPVKAPRVPLASAVTRLDAEFTRVRTALALSIAQTLDDADRGEDRGHFLPWRRACFRLQQAMEAAVGPLRAQARAVLQAEAARHAAFVPLGTLAALDAALAQALAPREQAQLALMPVLLEKHFMQQSTAPGAFRAGMQGLLHAELELRLQPALGLLDALRAAHTGST